jgi:hypothetical protein
LLFQICTGIGLPLSGRRISLIVQHLNKRTEADSFQERTGEEKPAAGEKESQRSPKSDEKSGGACWSQKRARTHFFLQRPAAELPYRYGPAQLPLSQGV